MHLSALVVLASGLLAAAKPVSPRSLIGGALGAVTSPLGGIIGSLPLIGGPKTTPPTVVIAPGAWHSPPVYTNLRNELTQLGYPSSAVSLASVGTTDPNVGMLDDAAAIRAEITRQADLGNKVVVLAHSYAGVPASTAVSGLSVKDRAAAGKKGGVVGVLYVCAFVLPADVSLGIALNGQFPSWFNVTGQFMNPINPAQVFYNDVTPKPVVDQAVSQLRSETVKIAFEANQFEPWNNGFPVGYVYTTQDNAVPSSLQNGMTSVFPDGAFKATMSTGHAPFLSQPKALAANVRDAAVKFMSAS